MTSDIDDYIKSNWNRYTRAAITQQLEAAGHDRAAIHAAYGRVQAAQRAERGWRMGWREYLLLAVLGAIGAALVWAGEPYGSGIIAPIVYFIVVSICIAAGKALSMLVDGGSLALVAILLALVAVGGAALAMINSAPLLALPAVALAGLPAVLLIWFRSSNKRMAGLVGAALPIIAWLALTGTCYAPLYDTLAV